MRDNQEVQMRQRIKVQDIELSQSVSTVTGLAGYQRLRCIVRFHNTPLAAVDVPVTGDFCSGKAILDAILKDHYWPVMRAILDENLAAPLPSLPLDMDIFLNPSPPPPSAESAPLVTVAVCTRDRADNLVMCLDSLMELDYPALDILIVDNAPRTTATQELVEKYPGVRYVCEPRPGLDWARNRAIIEAKGEIVAYTDDDVVVDRYWVTALAQIFEDNPEVACVTGLVIPHELETEAQNLFEIYGGFGRGFQRKWYKADWLPWQMLGAGQFGTGANMAYRRSVFAQIGLFDPALDVGTVTNGGGDLEMYFRILKEGYTLVYEPGAIVRHRHRREYEQLRRQIENNGIGFYSYLVRSATAYPDEYAKFRKLGIWWLRWWNFRRYFLSFVRPTLFPRDLIWAELKGSFVGLFRYQKARPAAAAIEAEYGPQAVQWDELATTSREHTGTRRSGIAVRVVDLAEPLPDLLDVAEYGRVRVTVLAHQELVGSFDIENNFAPVRAMRLRQHIVTHMAVELTQNILKRDENEFDWSALNLALHNRFTSPETPTILPDSASVSVVVATYDRPDDLRDCLRSLLRQDTQRAVEFIVVDNHPASGLTSSVVSEFPDVRLVQETRQGLSYARNTGIAASTGDIIIATDDDVVIPPDWLEKIVAPFARSDVMIVTGNVLPYELETSSQIQFESYGGLGRGFKTKEYNRTWFDSYRRTAVPTWNIGATANAAFRAQIFNQPEIGLLHEALGAGTPTGCSEDTYLFYKVLKAGYTIVYEAQAYVWHKHRRSDEALERQIYNYSKGHIAYHLLTFLLDHDFRAIVYITYKMSRWRVKQFLDWALRRNSYPLKLILLETAGNWLGPWALWKSYRKMKRTGRSSPYVPVTQRDNISLVAEQSN
jgi:GT2 family glycosyltransferase